MAYKVHQGYNKETLKPKNKKGSVYLLLGCGLGLEDASKPCNTLPQSSLKGLVYNGQFKKTFQFKSLPRCHMKNSLCHWFILACNVTRELCHTETGHFFSLLYKNVMFSLICCSTGLASDLDASVSPPVSAPEASVSVSSERSCAHP